MTLAEKLKNSGACNPSFTKEELMSSVEKRILKYGDACYIIGTHVVTNLEGCTIGECNPYNRQYLYKWLREEGLKFRSKFNGYGVETIQITV